MNVPNDRSKGEPAVTPGSVNLTKVIYGSERPALDDLAENLHEASKLNETLSARELPGAALLEVHSELAWSTSRSIREHDGYEPHPLPPARLPPTAFADLLRLRRSRSAFAAEPVGLEDVAALLSAGYGVTSRDELTGAADDGLPVFPHRTVPSGGGLYPLELYVLALRVRGLDEGVYHYHPLRDRLELVCRQPLQAALAGALVYQSFLDAAVGFAIAGVFWRSRFKYGLRGYRFVLLEAGHVSQNLVLAATALGLASCPCAGFFERRIDPLLELDGVEHSTLVSVFVGHQA